MLLPPIDSLPPVYTLIYFVVLILASGTAGVLLKSWLDRPKTSAEIHESRARTDLANFQATKTLAETLRTVSTELQESVELVEQRDAYIRLLEEQVQRAQANGYLDEIQSGSVTRSAGGSGNPAALPPAS